jgi:DNA processing protein
MQDKELLSLWLRLYQQPYRHQLLAMQAMLENPDDSESIINAHLLPVKQTGESSNEQVLNIVSSWLAASDKHSLISFLDLPRQLQCLSDPPLLLFCAGDPSLLNHAMLAVIGSRNPSHVGVENAKSFCQVLCTSGWTLVSGMAKGIDGISHQIALEQESPTVAVIGTGHEHCYPPEHQTLYHRLINHGLVISEYLPDTKVAKYQFPRRNRLISGLAKGVLVIEAAAKSGTLITSDYAAEQGRDLFAVPGDVDNPKVQGCHNLIRQGATLVACAAQINAFYQLALPEKQAQGADSTQTQASFDFQENNLTEQEMKVLDCLERRPILLESIISRTKLKLELVLSVLFSLELKGLVTNHAGGYLKRQPE